MFPTQNDHRLMELTCAVPSGPDALLGEWLQVVAQGGDLFSRQDLVRPQRLSSETERVISLTPFEMMLCGWSLGQLHEALTQLPAQNWNAEWTLPNIQRLSQVPAMEMDQSDSLALSRTMAVARELKGWRQQVGFVGPWEALAARSDYLLGKLDILPDLVRALEGHGLAMTAGTVRQFENADGKFSLPRRWEASNATLLLLAGPTHWWRQARAEEWTREPRFEAARALLDQQVFLEPATARGSVFPKRRV